MTAGVVVGRFQCATPHKGHQHILNLVKEKHDLLVIVIGVAATLDIRNPLSYHSRALALRALYHDALIVPLRDTREDAEWCADLEQLLYQILPGVKCTLYGARDSCLTCYEKHGRYLKVKWIDSLPNEQAQDHRRLQIERDSPLFREGVIFQTNRLGESPIQCVDIIVMAAQPIRVNGRPQRMVVAVKKPGEHLWRFPGGHVNPGDASLEDAAVRELAEETGLSDIGLTYLGSGRVNDYRYRGRTLMTAAFVGETAYGPLVPGGDIVTAAFVREDEASIFIAEHGWLAKLAFAPAEAKEETVV